MADINVIVLPDGTEYPVSDYYLPVSISSPTNGQVLKYDATNQVWYNGDDAEGSSVFYGTSAPTSQLGTNGNLYVKYTEGTGGASDTVDALYVKLDGAWCQISTGGGGGASSADDISVDDTDLEYSADDVQEALEKVYKTITLEDYHNLPAADKNNGTIYFITDVKGANQLLEKTASGAVANFTTDKAENLVNCVCEVASGSSEINVVACGKNLLPITLQNLKNNNSGGAWNDNAYTLNGITYTCNQDVNGNITNISVSGTATNLSLFRLGGKFPTYLKDGNYYFNGIPSNASNPSAFIQIQNFDTSSGISNITTNDTLLTINSSRYNQGIVIRVNSGNSINTPVIFTPMFRLASETDDTFEPYNGTKLNIPFGETLSGNGSFDVLSGILTRSDDTTKQLSANYIQANNGINNVYCDTGDISVQFILSVGSYVNQNV